MFYLAIAIGTLFVCVFIWIGASIEISAVRRRQAMSYLGKRFEKAVLQDTAESKIKAVDLHGLYNQMILRHGQFVWRVATFRNPYGAYSTELRHELGRL